MIKKIKKNIDKVLNTASIAIGGAIKGVEEGLYDSTNNTGINIVAKKEQAGTLADSLLNGVITQEVKDLRYRNYLITEESSDYKTFGEAGNAVSIKLDKIKPIVDETEEDCEVLLVQKIRSITSSVTEGVEGDLKNGNHKVNYQIKIKRDYISRFLLEKFTTKVVLKKIGDKHQLDFYTTIYPDRFDAVANCFTREVEKIFNNIIKKSDVVDFSEVSFSTLGAYGMRDGSECSFKINRFIECCDFKYYDEFREKKMNSGSYILKFDVTPILYDYKLSDKFHEEELSERYKNKEQKEYEIYNVNLENKKFEQVFCEDCGKEIGYEYDIETGEKVIDEETESPLFDETAILDLRITQRDFGKNLCPLCVNKIIESYDK